MPGRAALRVLAVQEEVERRMSTLVSKPDSVAPPDKPAPIAGRMVRVAALVLVAISVLVRWWVVGGRDYFNDDFRLLHLANTHSLGSPSYLGYDYDGQFMPGAMLLAGLVERLAPLQWWLAAVTVVGMQLLASLALLRLLRVLLGDRPLLLVPLSFGLFSPLTLGSLSWWAAALNSLPLQIGLAWVITEAVLLVRTGQRRHVVRGTVGVAVTLAFYLKAVMVPPVAFAVVALVLMRGGEPSWIRETWRRGRALWRGSLAVLVVWSVLFLLTRSRPPTRAEDGFEVLETVYTGLGALVVTLVGGPIRWAQFPPGAPIADSPGWLLLTGGLLLLAACVWTCRRLQGAPVVWALVTSVTVSGLVLAAAGRALLNLGDVLPLAYRYFAVEAVLLPVAGALLATLPVRDRKALSLPRVTAVVTVLFTVVALASTVNYVRAWDTDRSGSYLATARQSLAAAGPAPLLDQTMPADVMWMLSYPWNKVSRSLSSLEERPAFADSTTDLRMLDDAGRLRPADVVPGASLAAGPVPGCGWEIAGGEGTVVPTDMSLYDWDWTARLQYSADRDGTILVAFPSGEAVRTEVRAGSNTVYVRLVGGGQAIRLTLETPEATVCLRIGLVGPIAFR